MSCRAAVIGRSLSDASLPSAAWEDLAVLPSLDNFDAIVVDLTTLTADTEQFLRSRQIDLRRFLFAPPRESPELVVIGHHVHATNLIDLCPVQTPLDRMQQFIVSPDAPADLAWWFAQVEELSGAFDGQWSGTHGASPRHEKKVASTPTGLTAGLTYIINSAGKNSFPVTWLPATTRIPTDEGIVGLLRRRFGVDATTPPPGWVPTLPLLPRHSAATELASELHSQVQSVKAQLKEAEADREGAGRFIGLLYEQGSNLEHLVRDALRELGAVVEEPGVKGGDDGRLLAPTGHCVVLEIKGLAGQVGRDHVRQLMDWVDIARDMEPTRGWGGLVVSNSQRLTAPTSRDEPLAPNARQRLRELGFRATSTLHIYEALFSLQSEEDFDIDQWWTDLLTDAPPDS